MKYIMQWLKKVSSNGGKGKGLNKLLLAYVILIVMQTLSIQIRQRVVAALLLHAALENSYNLRVVLNVAIVAMVEPAAFTNSSEVACPMFPYVVKKRQGGLYKWPRIAEARILYAFYAGYTLSNFPGGYLADMYGARHVLGIMMIIGFFITIIFPFAVQNGGPWAAVVLRLLLGLSQGSILPCISAMVSQWIPDKERPFLGALAYSGSCLGPILGNAFTGIIIEQTNSWPNAFYMWSGVCLGYLVFHFLYMYSAPDLHPFISQDEAEFLAQTIVTKKKKKTPWKAILTNKPFWACTIGHFGHNYIFYSLITFLPTYMREILRFDIQTNALFSALPFMALWMCSLGIGAIANIIINKGLISRRYFGYIFGTMGQWGSSLSALLAVYVGCNRELVIFLFVVALGLKSLYYMTMTVNINVLSLNYAGTLFAICNGICSMTGVIGNAVIGTITKNGKLHEWKLAFWITFGLALVTSAVYIIFSADERQPFDFDESEESPEK